MLPRCHIAAILQALQEAIMEAFAHSLVHFEREFLDSEAVSSANGAINSAS
jgi:hypothetical protein